MKFLHQFFFLIGLQLMIFSNAVAGELSRLRMAEHPNGTIRLVLQTEKETPYAISVLKNPFRLVVDFEKSQFSKDIKQELPHFKNVMNDIRIGMFHKTTARVVLEPKKPLLPQKHFYLKPQSGFQWRFVLDLKEADDKEVSVFKPVGKIQQAESKKTTHKKYSQNTPYKKPIIVIDPGHGGKDPGAISQLGYYEKNLTLMMGKELYAALIKTGDYRVYMTRDKDIALPLRERTRKAHRLKADLFISIHADSAKNKNARGLSVYTISERASDREAQLLAERENKADIILNVDLSNQSKEVSNILIDLAKRETMNKSVTFATLLVNEMKKEIDLVPNAHRFAGFVVLKSANIPSVLIEMGYLSNKQEERLLKQKSYRKKIVGSIERSIRRYFGGD